MSKVKYFFDKIYLKFKIGCIVILFIFFGIPFIFGFIGSLFESLNEEEKISLADGFTIEKYNVILDVKDDNKVDVTENLTVNFTSAYKHGIYKYTPEWLEYKGKDGKVIKRKSNVLDYRADNDIYTVDRVNKKARIKIGDANEYVGKGEKTYVIKYTYDMGKDPFNGFDEFIFHAYGDYWGTEIKNASIEVNMPKSIEGYNVNFFTDKYRKENVNEAVDFSIDGNTLKANFNESKNYEFQLKNYCEKHYEQYGEECDYSDFEYYYEPLSKSLTVDVELPEGYFKGGSYNYGFGSIFISILVFILTGYTIYKWFKFGKNYAKNVQTVEFYPPEGLSSAEIGYVYNKRQANKKLTISLIVQLASKGYIKIDEIKDDIKITNLMVKPKELKSFDDMLPKREIEVKKLKEADDKLSRSETTMMVHLFKKGDVKKLKTNIDRFLKVKDSLVNGGYIEVISDNEEERLKDIKQKRKEYDENVKNYDKQMAEYNERISKMPEISVFEKIVYDRLFNSKDEIILSEHKTFYKAFSEVESTLKKSFKDKVYDKTSSKQRVYAIARTLLILLLSIISYKVIEDMDPKFSILYYLSFGCILVNILFIILMGRKTKYGEMISAKVMGFREFLVTAEKSKLEQLVSENPYYFYNILPYTYVLNISKKWIQKFENIEIPEIDMGNFDYGSDNFYYSIYDHVYYPPSSSGSSSSSCGGGCSSCGGGCSSCGGGGSW